MLSRVAETLYWMTRYVERAENVARLVNINNMLLMDLPKGISTGWAPLLDIIGVREAYEEQYSDYSEQTCLKYLLVGKNNSSSILNSVSNARENARTAREVLPRDAWEGINSLYHYIKDNQNEGLTKRGRFGYLKKVIESAHLIGTLDAAMNHDNSYTFARFGSLLERADMTTRILDVRSASLITSEVERPFDNIQWISVLRSISAYQMYRQTMGIRVQRQDVIEFMLHNETFPRSINFCLTELSELIKPVVRSESLVKLINERQHSLINSDVRSLKNMALHDYIDTLQIDFADIHKALAELYFLK